MSAIPKSPSQTYSQQPMNDEIKLTPRQRDVAHGLLMGLGVKEIASRFRRSVRVVKDGERQMFYMFGIHAGIKRLRLAIKLHEMRGQLGLDCPACQDDAPDEWAEAAK